MMRRIQPRNYRYNLPADTAVVKMSYNSVLTDFSTPGGALNDVTITNQLNCDTIEGFNQGSAAVTTPYWYPTLFTQMQAQYSHYTVYGCALDISFHSMGVLRATDSTTVTTPSSPRPIVVGIMPVRNSELTATVNRYDYNLENNAYCKYRTVGNTAFQRPIRLKQYLSAKKFFGTTYGKDMTQMAVQMGTSNTAVPVKRPDTPFRWSYVIFLDVSNPDETATVMYSGWYQYKITWYVKFFNRRNQQVLSPNG